MNSYIKHIIEAFDFNSVNKQKKAINAIDILKKEQLPIIFEHIDKREQLNDQDYFILTSFTGIYKVSNHDELKELIEYFIDQFGNKCDLNWIDVSNVTDMRWMFSFSEFNGDISKWNVSNVTTMERTFEGSYFNSDISKWDTSNVANMEMMFCNSKFNRDISKWDVSNVTKMNWMFCDSKFNGDISQWNVSNVKNMSRTFEESAFNGNISKWNINPECNTTNIFKKCPIKKEYKPKNIKKNKK